MKTSPEGLRLITQREGKVLHVYRDSQGYPTAGVGHLLSAAEKKAMPVGTKITEQQCTDWLIGDLKECEDAVNNVGAKLAQNEFDALVSLSFNIGVGGFNKSTVVRRLKANNHPGAAEAILLWNKPPEIQGRRRGEYHQFKTPYSSAAVSTDRTEGAPSDGQPAGDTTDGTPSPSQDTAADNQQGQTTTFDTPQGTGAAVTTSTNVAVEKEQQVGFLAKIKLKLVGWFATLGGLTGINQYKQQFDDLGLPGWIILYLIIGVVVGAIIWLICEFAFHVVEWWGKRKRTDTLAAVNSTPTNSVIIVPQDQLAQYADKGWVIIHRSNAPDAAEKPGLWTRIKAVF